MGPDSLISYIKELTKDWLSTVISRSILMGHVVNKNRSLFTPWVISGEHYGFRLIIEVKK